LGQVITNLIENARSFVPEEHGRVAISLSRSGKSIIVTIDDNGPGIRADNIERIFERFYTDRPAGEAFGQNSGLGLSISRQIVEGHGGTLTAENIPGAKPGEIRGARFVVTLPADN
jgi:two-component system sensor histidine kinase ChvG